MPEHIASIIGRVLLNFKKTENTSEEKMTIQVKVQEDEIRKNGASDDHHKKPEGPQNGFKENCRPPAASSEDGGTSGMGKDEVGQPASTKYQQTLPARIENYSNGMPQFCKRLFERTCLGTQDGTMPYIKAMCQYCVGYDDYQNRIRDCQPTVPCPLWQKRPYQHGASEEKMQSEEREG